MNPNEPSWFCPLCGHQNQLTFKHCTECGTALPPGAATTATETAAPPSPISNKKVAVIIGSLVVLGCVLTLFVSLNQPQSPSAAVKASPTIPVQDQPTPKPSPLTPQQQKTLLAAAAALGGERRKRFGDDLETKFLKSGMDVSVKVSGKESRAIRLAYVLWSRPLIYKMTTEGKLLDQLSDQGFTMVVFDGSSETWTLRYNEKTEEWGK